MADYSASVNHLGFSGYVATSGGMGISEKLFLVIFAPIFGTGLLLPGMILSRGLGYYTELLVSAVLTIVANFTIGKGKKVRENVGNL